MNSTTIMISNVSHPKVAKDQTTAEEGMRRAGSEFTRSVNTWVFILAVVAMAGTTSSSAARADEAQAKTLFKAMSDYLAAQKAISFAYNSTLEVVTERSRNWGWQVLHVDPQSA